MNRKQYNPPLGQEQDISVMDAYKVTRTFVPGDMVVYHCYIKASAYQNIARMMTGEDMRFSDEFVLITHPVADEGKELVGMAYDIALQNIMNCILFSDMTNQFTFSKGALIMSNMRPEVVE